MGLVEIRRERETERFFEMAVLHDREAQMARRSADDVKERYVCSRPLHAYIQEAEFLDMVAYHARLAQKYRSMSKPSTPSSKDVLP
jgi:hypothetical protein